MTYTIDLLESKIRAELAGIGLRWAKHITWNANAAVLYQAALEQGEGMATDAGALAIRRSSFDQLFPHDALPKVPIQQDLSSVGDRCDSPLCRQN